MTEFPPYPSVPSYDAPQPGAPKSARIPPASTRPASTPPRPARSGSRLSVAAGVALNLVTLVGVLGLGWPPGNAFLLFWIENAVLGLFTVASVVTARGAAADSGGTVVRGLPAGASSALYALFFTFHYGIFCLVHLSFTLIVAGAIGIRPSFLLLGLPVALMVIRYSVEVATTWFGADGLRAQTSPARAMMQPYPRIAVLHVSVMIGFAVVMFGVMPGMSVPPASPGALAHVLQILRAALPEQWRSPGVLLVLVLILLKTVVDVATTRRATRQSDGRSLQWEFNWRG